MGLNDSICTIKGVGEKTAQILEKLSIKTVGDLISYYPRNYDVFRLPVKIRELKDGNIEAVECAITSRPALFNHAGRKVISLSLSDETGKVKLMWFNSPFILKQLKIGTRLIFRGRVVRRHNEVMLSQPAFYTRDEYISKLSVMQPIYSVTSGITSNQINKLVHNAIGFAIEKGDYLSAKQRKQLELIKYEDAITSIHFPIDEDALLQARNRIVFDEFTSFILRLRKIRHERNLVKNNYILNDFSICDRIIERLPYSLTDAQLKVFSEIKNDISGKSLMSRMVQGDVGSGKTVVALLTMAAFSFAGYQSCLMAPTDVLAGQHFEYFNRTLREFNIKIALLTGSTTAAAKRKILADIAEGNIDIVIGTHALIQDNVNYKNLALAVIDEQHRFGVKQREALKNKGYNPHILVMSATPIPRSLAIIMFGDLKLSLIDKLPANRLPIKNCVVGASYRNTAFKFITEQVRAGHQAYIICPMIDENEELELENVLDYSENFKNSVPSDIVSGYLHGRMKQKEKQAVMDAFSKGEIHVLISTTVVEVGVNVPNATVMMVENCERFGLAQLHQLRGRVGRGDAQSYCIFVKGIESSDVNERLNILVKYNNGFDVAEQDLKQRGQGDLFGVRQSGDPSFNTADIYSDAEILKKSTDFINGLSEIESEGLYDSVLFSKTIEYDCS